MTQALGRGAGYAENKNSDWSAAMRNSILGVLGTGVGGLILFFGLGLLFGPTAFRPLPVALLTLLGLLVFGLGVSRLTKGIPTYEKFVGIGIIILGPAAGLFCMIFALSSLMHPDIRGLQWWMEMGRRMVAEPVAIACLCLVLLSLGLICFGSWMQPKNRV